jgi:serine/threonine protein phosphatase 1
MIVSNDLISHSEPVRWPYQTHAGERVYAIGDIHGQFRQLEILFQAIIQDLKREPPPQYRIICLGDLVDRGERSRDVIQLLIDLSQDFPLTILRGNHEDMLLRAIDEPSYLLEWRKYGGLETMASYRVNAAPLMQGKNVDIVHQSFKEKFEANHRRFIEHMPFYHISADYFFCHAGIKPGQPLSQQDPIDLLWIRDEFLESQLAHGKMIVHGHTSVESVDIRPNRINVDTGAYLTGRLSCVVLQDQKLGIIDSKSLDFTCIL